MTSAAKVCLIEDDELLGESLCDRFRMEGLGFDWHRDGRSALLALERRQYALALCDLRLPDVSGREVFESLGAPARPPFVFMTGFGTIDEAVGLLKAGAADFVTKPFDLDQLMVRLHDFCEAPPPHVDDAVFGISPSMRKIESLMSRLADSMEPVLVAGESGVGKEVFALSLHESAKLRRPGGWVAVNCAAIPEALIEAELFGYVRGAFTGAAKAHRGFIEQANGGTLFLDEIGDMPLSMQARLLRVLQEHKVTRIGAEASTYVDFRLVCATHRDLPAMVRSGHFREDLYYRINVLTVQVPPLRERREDILWLADRMLRELTTASKQRIALKLSLEAQQALFAHGWPGNARELNHVLRRALALGAGPTLEPYDLFPLASDYISPLEPKSESRSLSEHLEQKERAFLVAVLQEHHGVVTEAAARLDISRKTLWEKMRRYGIARQQFAVEPNGGAAR
ncbi:sigma-54-dependent transcriptional regulator [Variovorax sp. GT1P44]|uniref:sigma-54-dependent transcriptional regulator n=1 Tax=Variovorax sp. GT1P44 TaxID=3443742 RepID=UPI003F480473